MKKLFINISLALSFQLLASSCFAQPQSSIRVLIKEDSKSLSLKLSGNYKIIDLRSNQLLSQGRDINTTVMGYKGEMLLAGKSFDTNRLLIKTDKSEAIIINGRTFRGDIQIIRDSGFFSIINQIELEDYIKGILYHEASHYWPMEVLKAQAIVCRTYAVYQMQQNKLKEYDVTNDIYSRVYGGRTSERYRTNLAVEATKAKILTYQNKVFPAYFHATCAGHTEDAKALWDVDLEPLRGVVCNFCKDSPHFDWHLVLDRGEVRERLVDAGYKIGVIKNIAVLGKDKSGRISDLKITSTKKDLHIPAKDFRNIIGPNEIRSTNFTVDLIGEDAVFEGFGWGHGVGLCQWGAYFMAKDGSSAEQILKYYYPGSEIKYY